MNAPQDVGRSVGRSADRTDHVLATMADPDRRAVVGEVFANERTTVDDLAELLADGERTERAAKIRLVHCHLPKLADAGAVSYDRDEGTVEPGRECPAAAAELAVPGPD